MPIGIQTTCLYSLVPNQIKMLSAQLIHFDMTMHDIFLGFSEVKNAFLSLHARYESLLSEKFFQ